MTAFFLCGRRGGVRWMAAMLLSMAGLYLLQSLKLVSLFYPLVRGMLGMPGWHPGAAASAAPGRDRCAGPRSARGEPPSLGRHFHLTTHDHGTRAAPTSKGLGTSASPGMAVASSFPTASVGDRIVERKSLMRPLPQVIAAAH